MNRSKVYEQEGKLFRYNYDDSMVEYVHKASEEDVADEAEWLEKYGKPLFHIDSDGYMVIDSIGLSRENWENREARNGYLTSWAMDLDAESSRLAADFVKYELPYLV